MLADGALAYANASLSEHWIALGESLVVVTFTVTSAWAAPVHDRNANARIASERRIRGRILLMRLASNDGVEALEVRLERQPSLLGVLLGDRADRWRISICVPRRPPEGSREGAVADRAAGELELVGEELKVHVFRDRSRRRQHEPPDPPPVLRFGKWEVHDEVEPPHERVVDVATEVRGEDHGARIRLHPLQEVRDLDVRVPVVGVGHLRALTEQRVGLVEEQDRVGAVGGGEDPLEVLLRLADVLRDDRREVDPEQVEPESAAPRTCAAIVLPVPDSPANSTLRPCVRETVVS